jgi:hypothetical protein
MPCNSIPSGMWYILVVSLLYLQNLIGMKKQLQAGRVFIHDSHRNRIVKVSHVRLFHDSLFKGLGSLPKFLDLTPRYQIDSLLIMRR